MKKSPLLLIIIILTLTACGGPKEVIDMAYTTEICGNTFAGSFDGTVVDNIPNGLGTFVYENSKQALTYTGQWENGLPIGTGELEYNHYILKYAGIEYTGTYTGEVENGLPNGEGKFKGEKRDKYLIYEGLWKDGALADEGYLTTNAFALDVGDGMIEHGKFDGNVVDGIPFGEGTYSATNSNEVAYTYSGKWENGKFNGYGVLKYDHDNMLTYKGNFTNGLFTPTPEQFYKTIGTWRGGEYHLTDSSSNFLKTYPDIFISHSIEGFNLDVKKNLDFKEFSKNPKDFGNTLVSVRVQIIQIIEDYIGETAYTYCIGKDGNGYYYYINMLGHANKIYVNNWITATILPLDYFTYTTVVNTKIWAMAAAAVTIVK